MASPVPDRGRAGSASRRRARGSPPHGGEGVGGGSLPKRGIGGGERHRADGPAQDCRPVARRGTGRSDRQGDRALLRSRRGSPGSRGKRRRRAHPASTRDRRDFDASRARTEGPRRRMDVSADGSRRLAHTKRPPCMACRSVAHGARIGDRTGAPDMGRRRCADPRDAAEAPSGVLSSRGADQSDERPRHRRERPHPERDPGRDPPRRPRAAAVGRARRLPAATGGDGVEPAGTCPARPTRQGRPPPTRETHRRRDSRRGGQCRGPARRRLAALHLSAKWMEVRAASDERILDGVRARPGGAVPASRRFARRPADHRRAGIAPASRHASGVHAADRGDRRGRRADPADHAQRMGARGARQRRRTRRASRPRLGARRRRVSGRQQRRSVAVRTGRARPRLDGARDRAGRRHRALSVRVRQRRIGPAQRLGRRSPAGAETRGERRSPPCSCAPPRPRSRRAPRSLSNRREAAARRSSPRSKAGTATRTGRPRSCWGTSAGTKRRSTFRSAPTTGSSRADPTSASRRASCPGAPGASSRSTSRPTPAHSGSPGP